MTFRGRRGERDPGPYPLLPKCEECGHVQPTEEAVRINPARVRHFAKCSKALPWQKSLWRRREELRALRTARRVGE